MLKTFAYNATGLESGAIDIIESALSLARQTYEEKKESDYEAKNRFLCGALASFAVANTRFESRLGDLEGAARNDAALAMFKEPMVTGNPMVRSNFELIVSQVVSAINPEVSNDIFSRFIAETRQIGYGDTAVFRLESNELFAVKEMAEGIRKGVDQPIYNDEITVHPTLVGIDTHIDWYPFAAGRFDMGNFAVKIAKSFAAYIFIKTWKGLTQATTLYGAAYTVNGVSAQQWTTLAQRVQAANGGMKVIAVGTALALNSCTASGNFQVAIGEPINRVGYLDQYLNVPLIAVDNVLAVGTTNGSARLVLPDDRIYMIPVAGDKPVKIVFEGNQTIVTDNPEDTSDVRLGLSIKQRIGVSCIVGAKLGTITL